MGKNIQKHTTNYADVFYNCFEDTKTLSSKTPKPGTIAYLQYQLITENPYQFTSDEIMFKVHAMRTPGVKENSQKDYLEFFSTPKACFRSSPLVKSHGFGIHFNSKGKAAIYGMETKEYAAFLKDKKLKIIKGMRSARV